MKNNKKILILIFIVLILLVISVIILLNIKKENNKDNIISNKENLIYENNNINNEDIANNTIIEELKNQTGVEGNTEIYEVQTEYDGRKVLAVKANTKYKVALSGMIKNGKPTYNELDDLINSSAPKNTGIWIQNNSREKIKAILNSNKYTNSTYFIDKDGYVKIQDKNSQNEIDKKLEKIINGNKQYIINISSVCYIVDNITGEILDYNFEKMDKYQTYEYFEDDNLMIIFVNQNTNKQLSEKEIFESIINVL